MSGFYNFFFNMYFMKRIDAAKVQSYVPKLITQDEADIIIATPQYEGDN